MNNLSPMFRVFPAFQRYPWAAPGVGASSPPISVGDFRITSEDDTRVDSDDNPRIYGE